VVQAAAMGEAGQVYVLDMGEPVRIVDLARDMIRLSGHSVDEIRIVFTGLRPGEKLYEELLADSDTSVPTVIARLSVARLDDAGPAAEVLQWLRDLIDGETLPSDGEVRSALHRLVKEFKSGSGG